MKACRKARLLSLYSVSAMFLSSMLATRPEVIGAPGNGWLFQVELVTKEVKVTRIDAPRVECQDLRQYRKTMRLTEKLDFLQYSC